MTPVRLDTYDNAWYHPGGSRLKRAAWFFFGQPLLGSSFIPSSSLRVHLLRAFGARIGTGATIKPSVQIKYPWHLVVGDHCWIGEHVWIDNLTTVTISSHCCLSQGAYLCTGNHDWSDPSFGLRISPIRLEEGAWVGAKAILVPGALLERGAIAAAGAVITGTIPTCHIYAGNPAQFVKVRTVRSSTSEQHDQCSMEALS